MKANSNQAKQINSGKNSVNQKISKKRKLGDLYQSSNEKPSVSGKRYQKFSLQFNSTISQHSHINIQNFSAKKCDKCKRNNTVSPSRQALSTNLVPGNSSNRVTEQPKSNNLSVLQHTCEEGKSSVKKSSQLQQKFKERNPFQDLSQVSQNLQFSPSKMNDNSVSHIKFDLQGNLGTKSTSKMGVTNKNLRVSFLDDVQSSQCDFAQNASSKLLSVNARIENDEPNLPVQQAQQSSEFSFQQSQQQSHFVEGLSERKVNSFKHLSLNVIQEEDLFKESETELGNMQGIVKELEYPQENTVDNIENNTDQDFTSPLSINTQDQENHSQISNVTIPQTQTVLESSGLDMVSKFISIFRQSHTESVERINQLGKWHFVQTNTRINNITRQLEEARIANRRFQERVIRDPFKRL
eukprot:403339652